MEKTSKDKLSLAIFLMTRVAEENPKENFTEKSDESAGGHFSIKEERPYCPKCFFVNN